MQESVGNNILNIEKIFINRGVNMSHHVVKLKAILSDNLKIIQMGENIYNLVNYKMQDFLEDQSLFKKIIHPLDYDLYKKLTDLEKNDHSILFRVRLVHRNGKVLITRFTGQKKYDEKTQSTTLDLSIEDVTVYLDSTNDNTDARFFGAMMEKTDDYIFFKTRDHLFAAASQTLVDLTSENHWKDLIGKTDYQVFPKEYADVYYSLEKKIFSGEVQIAHEIQETLDNDGQKGWVDNRKYPIKNDQGEIIGLFGIARDITELVRAKNEVKRLNKGLQDQVEGQLEEIRKKDQYIFDQTRLAHMGEMAAGVGHEINNPLSISMGNISIIKEKLKSGDYDINKILKKLERVEDGHERIRKIVDGLRIYARTNNDNEEIFSLNGVIDKTIDFVSEIYKKEGVEIVKEKFGTELFIKGNFGKFQQVLLNLVSNAKDATEGRKSRIIKLSIDLKANNIVVFSVSDNGSGISEDIKDKILNPFFTTKKVGKGTGMGLGFVSEITKIMNGHLKIDSTKGKGSRFSITLPLINDNNIELKKQNNQQKTIKIKGSALVIDDEEAIRDLICEHLRSIGLDVDEADDGDTGLKKVQLKKYDYIFTDMKMPRMNGGQFIREARKLPFGETKIFIVTGGVGSDFSDINMRAALDMADAYILKPFTCESICTVIFKELAKLAS